MRYPYFYIFFLFFVEKGSYLFLASISVLEWIPIFALLRRMGFITTRGAYFFVGWCYNELAEVDRENRQRVEIMPGGTMNTKYYELLFRGIDSDDRVIDIVRGHAWTAAILSNGNVGVAMHTEGETVSRMFPSLVGMKISQAAYAVMSWNMEEASEGMAVVNAYYNTRERTETLCTGMSFSGALDGLDISGKTIGLVGHLVNHSGISQQLLEKAEKCYILEREPKPGDYPDSACEYLLPQCDIVVITGSAAINKTMPRLLTLSQNSQIILTGPSVTLCAELMSLGIKRLYGLEIEDCEGLCTSIVEAPSSINRFGRRFCLDKI